MTRISSERPSEEELAQLTDEQLFEVALETLGRIEASAIEQSRMLREADAEIEARLSDIRATNARIERRLGIGRAAADAAE